LDRRKRERYNPNLRRTKKRWPRREITMARERNSFNKGERERK
jgi:hypothetical protein